LPGDHTLNLQRRRDADRQCPLAPLESSTPAGSSKQQVDEMFRIVTLGWAQMLAGAMKRANRKDLARLKSILERERS
jgi:hypothetical protein